jgi:flagellar hook-associated protein 3 FlgL
MALISTSDIANSLFLRRSSTALKQALAQSRQELTTGRAADPVAALRGQTGPLAALERNRSLLEAYATATAESGLHTDAQQTALARVSGATSDTFGQILALGPSPGRHMVDPVARNARGAFEQTVIALNTRLSDRSLFAGAASDRPALAPAADILAALVAETAGATSATEATALVDAWFDTPGGGFETMAYLGATTPAGPVAVAPGDAIRLEITAARDELRPALKGLALAALVAEGVPGTTHEERAALLETAGQRLLSAQTGVTGLMAELGAAEARIAAAAVRNTAERTAMELAVNDLIGVDPFDAATRLEDTRGRIEALFAITGRLQRLSLTEFLR